MSYIRNTSNPENLYIYAENNSNTLTDPSGLVITVDMGNVPDNILVELNLLILKNISPTASEFIAYLNSSPVEYTIVPSAIGNYYNSTTKTIGFSNYKFLLPSVTDATLIDEPWRLRPPFIGLAHEIAHAYRDASCGLAKTNIAEELYNLKNENKIRKEFGLSNRDYY